MLRETDSSSPAHFLSVTLWENRWFFILASVPGSQSSLVHFELGQGVTDSLTHPTAVVLTVGSCTCSIRITSLGTGYTRACSQARPDLLIRNSGEAQASVFSSAPGTLMQVKLEKHHLQRCPGSLDPRRS